jgi:N-dimethylarginine dimethylaminohydrolase
VATVEKHDNGEITVVIESDDVPANPPGTDEMSKEQLDEEHYRRLKDDPTFEEGRAPKSWLFHDQVTYEDELEPLWGKKWGNQGVGRLREVMLTVPPENEVRDVFYKDTAAYMEQWEPEKPDLDVWREQYEVMKKNYRDNGTLVHEVIVPDAVFGPYGYTRWFWAATDACWVINGGAIIPRGGYFGAQKGREPVWHKALALLDIPIIYAVRGRGVAELGGEVWLDNHHMLVSDGTVMNFEAARQLKQVFELSDAKLVQIPTSGHYEYTAFPSGGTSHVDMVVGIPDVGKAVLYPPYTSFTTVKFFQRIGYDIIEVPSDEYLSGVYNMVVLEPGTVMCPTKGASRTIKAMEEAGITVVPTEMTESMKAGGAVHCSTAQLLRDPGPVCEKLMETPLERLAPEFVVPEWEKDWSDPARDWGYSLEGLTPPP